MKPLKREFEKVKVEEWLKGEISKIEYEKKHEFTFEGVKTLAPAVRVTITLDDYKDPKSTGWWKFNYSDKSKVFKFFLEPLVEGAHSKLDFDFDHLLHTRIKVMYTTNGEYQNLVMVRPDGAKIIPISTPAKKQEETAPDNDAIEPF